MRLRPPNPDSGYAVLIRLLREKGRAYLPQYGIALVFMALVAAATSLTAWIMRDVINELFVRKDFDSIRWIALAFLMIFVVKGLSSYFQAVFLARVGNAIVADQQRILHRRVLQQDLSFFDRYPGSDLVTRITYTSGAVRNVFHLMATSFGRDLLSVIGLVTVMAIQQPTLTVMTLVVAPVAFWGVARLIRRVRKVAAAELKSVAALVGAMQETVGGAKIVKAFNLEAEMSGRMEHAIRQAQKRNNKLVRVSARTSPLMEMLGGLAISGIIFYSGWLVIADRQLPGEFMSFLTAFLLAYTPAKHLARLNVELEAGLVGTRMMYELIDQPLTICDTGAPALCKGEGERAVSLADIHFRYSRDMPVLEGLNFRAESGRVTALVGHSGGGKSTIFNLIMRFYDPGRGVVRIGDTDISKVSLHSLRAQIAYVGQDPFLFSGTVGDNIRMGRPGASDGEVEAALQAAHADEFVRALPEGGNTLILDPANSFSGGQRQRLAIARAFLKDAPILLLDEATSALDNEAEAEIRNVIRDLARGRTTIVIAHRLSTIRFADQICVLSKGRIVETGQHEDLLKQPGSAWRALHDAGFV